jgi:hypothetical protein
MKQENEQVSVSHPLGEIVGIPSSLQPLVEIDKLREIDGLGKPAFIHDDHRWVLPILAWAQMEGLIMTPSLLVLFDRHTDFAIPFLGADEQGRKLATEYNAVPTVEAAIQVCWEHADPNDGDWVSAGMELGIIGDAVVFGAEAGHQCDSRKGFPYLDMQGRQHSFWSLPWPSGCLLHQGCLADHYYEPRGLWDALGWKPGALNLEGRSLILDFDLDAFAIDTHLGPNFSWPERIFEHQFHSKSNAASIEGMTAADFVSDLVRESSMITFAREPNYCGGEQDSDAIFELMNRYMFKSLASAV